MKPDGPPSAVAYLADVGDDRARCAFLADECSLASIRQLLYWTAVTGDHSK